MNNIYKAFKTIPYFLKGIFSLHKKVYRLSFVFVPEDNLWYIDIPWPGDRYNLAMVAGSNKLLDFLCEDNNYVTVDVLPRNKREQHEGYFECEQTASSLFGGSFYNVHGLEGFTHDIWICPVTLCVLGYYPKYIYIKYINNPNNYSLHNNKEV